MELLVIMEMDFTQKENVQNVTAVVLEELVQKHVVLLDSFLIPLQNLVTGLGMLMVVDISLTKRD